MSTYDEAVDAWSVYRETMGAVHPYTARKSAQKAHGFSPFFGSREIDELQASDVEIAIATLMRKGGRDGSGLSSTTLRGMHLAGRQAIDYAIKHGMANTNPFGDVPRPKAGKTRARFLDGNQIGEFATYTRNRFDVYVGKRNLAHAAFCLAVLVAMGTGMRRGEIFGLEWPDYDGKSISVQRSVKPDNTIGEPKTQSGIRRIAIGSTTAKALDDYKSFQLPLVPPRRWDEPTPVMCGTNGKRLSMNTFEHWWARFRKQAGFDGLKFHELRHTHASLLIASGTDVKTVQGRLGHSSADITMNIYAHALPRNDMTAAQAIDNLLGGAK